MPQKPGKTGSIVSESDLVALVTGAGYVAVQSVRNTGKAWHCLATADDGTVSALTVDPKARIHVDSDEPDQPDQPAVTPDQPVAPDQPADQPTDQPQ